ncbi:hypothetical protein ONE63_003368 [Megalurothrips usitatus]|uniref:Uncharacterized protein n=1 Tax=Megalurothrips usitatus TaxID=439358 RepID=A0AAV7XB27_9NEOP|nr:hypothetical protein ONE63_003368 [Megalurothrips usitatus]
MLLIQDNYFCFFRLYVVHGDNAGYHAIQGFFECFTASYYCRFCEMFKEVCKRRRVSVPYNLLRTVDNYRYDVNTNNVTLTGVKELCVWNEIPSYHCIVNFSCDIMHDLFEGVLKYDVCKILFSSINDMGYFSVETPCERVNGFNYGPLEQGNKPPTRRFSFDRFLNCSLNLSASKMICLTRYLGEMVGDLIPEGNSAWKLYLLLHDILDIIMCPVVEPGIDIHLSTLISEHHRYVNLFGDLKPKHHFMLHYPHMLKRNGPLSSLLALTSERTHPIGKMYAKACNSRIDFAFSVSVKYQLSLCTISEGLVKSKY